MNDVYVDSSVVLDVLTDDPAFYAASFACLVQWGSTHNLCIDPIVYAEVSVGFRRIEDLDDAIDGVGLAIRSVPRPALFLAGKAFESYRRRGGTKTSPLPDFLIGAHAAVEGAPLLTRDPARVRAAYPRLRIIDPMDGRPES
jgi:hypothetical protein